MHAVVSLIPLCDLSGRHGLQWDALGEENGPSLKVSRRSTFTTSDGGDTSVLCVESGTFCPWFPPPGGFSLCAPETRDALFVPVGPAPSVLALRLAAALILVHKQNRSYSILHSMPSWPCWRRVSGSDFSSPPPRRCSPLSQCLAAGSVTSLSSKEE